MHNHLGKPPQHTSHLLLTNYTNEQLLVLYQQHLALNYFAAC